MISSKRGMDPESDGEIEDDDGDDDLYGDLENNIFDRLEQGQRQPDQVISAGGHSTTQLESLLADSYEENEKLRMKLKTLSKAHAMVLKNASSLHETAKLEITQKNKVVSSLHKKLQEFRTKGSSVPDVEWKEIDKLISACLTSVPNYSFAELCQEALRTLQNDQDLDRRMNKSNKSKEWTKRFRHQNVSYYFYSHHEPTIHQEAITDIQYIGPGPSERIGGESNPNPPSPTRDEPSRTERLYPRDDVMEEELAVPIRDIPSRQKDIQTTTNIESQINRQYSNGCNDGGRREERSRSSDKNKIDREDTSRSNDRNRTERIRDDRPQPRSDDRNFTDREDRPQPRSDDRNFTDREDRPQPRSDDRNFTDREDRLQPRSDDRNFTDREDRPQPRSDDRNFTDREDRPQPRSDDRNFTDREDRPQPRSDDRNFTDREDRPQPRSDDRNIPERNDRSRPDYRTKTVRDNRYHVDDKNKAPGSSRRGSNHSHYSENTRDRKEWERGYDRDRDIRGRKDSRDVKPPPRDRR